MAGRPPELALPGDSLPAGVVADVRWTSARKEELLRRIRAGEISVDGALRNYRISVEELDGWMAAYRRRGQDGLKVTAARQGRFL